MQSLTKIWTFIKGLPRYAWEALIVVVSVLIAYFEISSKKKIEGKLDGAEADKKDAVLTEKQDELKRRDDEVVADGNAKKEEVANKTPEEIAKDLNKI